MRVNGRGSLDYDRKARKATARWSATLPDGKRKWVTKTFRDVGSKAEAWRMADEYREALNSGLVATSGKVTVGEYAEKWFGRCSGDWSQRTVKVYRIDVRHFCDAVGDVRMEDVNMGTVRRLESYLRGAGCTEGVVRDARSRFHQVVRDAVSEGVIPYDPISVMRPIKVEHAARHALTADEVARVRADAMEVLDGHHAALVIGIATGARVSEVLGLTWGDIEFDTDVKGNRLAAISIDKQRAEHGKEAVRTKTASSVRVTWADTVTNDWLKEWMGRQRTLLGEAGMEQGPDTPVCTNTRLEAMGNSTFDPWSRRWRGRHGHSFTFHQFRHTMATLKLAAGVDVMAVTASGGWSDANIVYTRYGHAVDENVALSAVALGRSMGVPDSGQ